MKIYVWNIRNDVVLVWIRNILVLRKNDVFKKNTLISKLIFGI